MKKDGGFDQNELKTIRNRETESHYVVSESQPNFHALKNFLRQLQRDLIFSFRSPFHAQNRKIKIPNSLLRLTTKSKLKTMKFRLPAIGDCSLSRIGKLKISVKTLTSRHRLQPPEICKANF